MPRPLKLIYPNSTLAALAQQESPPGLKKNLQRTLTSWGSEFIDGSQGQPPPPRRRGQLLFLLAWFHAVVQERRTYLPQGWSKAYEFSVGDLRAGASEVTPIPNPE